MIVCIGYGDELPVFVRARSIWAFYLSHFPEISVIFVRNTRELKRGEVASNGYDLLVGVGADSANADGPGYKETGVWSSRENAEVIYRQVVVYDYLLRKHTNPFFLFHATVTSVVDFRGLIALMEHLPSKGCFAGSPARLTGPPALEGFTFVSGANTLLSSDMVALLRSRYDQNSPSVAFPNDVWQAITLQDIPRIPLPMFSFIRPRIDEQDRNAVQSIVRNLISQGHYHFRIKTTSADDGFAKREDVDPWIMLGIMEAVLRSESRPQANLQFHSQFVTFISATSGGVVDAFHKSPIYLGPRSFPWDDIEFESMRQLSTESPRTMGVGGG